MKLISRIADVRPYGDGKAIDLTWRADDGSDLREDGAKEVEDQIDLPLDATDEQILAAIDQRRAQLGDALAAPGIGLTRDHAANHADLNQSLIGQEY